MTIDIRSISERALEDQYGPDRLIQIRDDLTRNLREIRKEIRLAGASTLLVRLLKDNTYERDVIRSYLNQVRRFGHIKG